MRFAKLVALGVVTVAVPVSSQTPTTAKPAFDVASIKPSAPGTRQAITIQPGGRFVASGVQLRLLIAIAYHLQAYQMSGGESWIAIDAWSIEAKAEDVSVIPFWSPPYIPDVMAVRLQSLLEDRFALKTHRETRELQMYTLTLRKGGSKLAVAEPPPQPTQPPAGMRPPLGPDGSIPANFAPPPGAILAGPGTLIGSAITMDQIVVFLNRLMDRPVIDKTGLAGYFDVKLQFAPESAPRATFGSGNADASRSEERRVG